MHSTPLCVIRQPMHILVVDNARFSRSLRLVSKLSIRHEFRGFPQNDPAHRTPWNMSGWLSLCDALASMPNLDLLCILVFQAHLKNESRESYAKYMREILEPLKRVKIREGGQFDFITRGWEMQCQFTDMPFRIYSTEEFLPSQFSYDDAGRVYISSHTYASRICELGPEPSS